VLQGALGDDPLLVDMHWLGQDLEGAEAEASGHGLRSRIAGDEDDGHVGVLAPNLPEQVDTVHAHGGHLEVGDDQRRPRFPKQVKRLADVVGRHARIAGQAEDLPHQLADFAVLRDDQDRGLRYVRLSDANRSRFRVPGMCPSVALGRG
jgi:hypothetical protein